MYIPTQLRRSCCTNRVQQMYLLVNDTASRRWRKRGIPKCRITVGMSSTEIETIRPQTHTESVSRQNSYDDAFANGQLTVRRYHHTLWDFAKEAPRAGLLQFGFKSILRHFYITKASIVRHIIVSMRNHFRKALYLEELS